MDVELDRHLIADATADRVAALFASDDPVAAVDAHLARFDELGRMIATERAKWERVREAAVAVVGSKSDQTQLRAVAGELAANEATEQEPSPASTNGSHNRTTKRAEAALKLMAEEPNRVWRLREIVEGVVDRGYLRSSPWLDNQLAKDLPRLMKQGRIDRPGKGLYKLPPTGASDGEGTEGARG